jgi:hypothetical protein
MEMKIEKVRSEKVSGGEHRNFIDESLVDFVQNVRNRFFKNPNNRNYSFGLVSERASKDINNLTGVDVTGYKHNLKGNAVEHIENRHGINGVADHSMADIENYGKIGYVLNNYDKVDLLRYSDGSQKRSKGILNSAGVPSPMVRYEKRVNGLFYVVEAVPDTKTKTLQIISAYKTGTVNRSGQMLDATQTPKPHVRNESAAILNNNVTHLREKVNTNARNLSEQ